MKLVLFPIFLLASWCAYAQSISTNSKRELSIEWEEIKGSAGYELEFVRLLGNETEKKPQMFKAKGTRWNGQIQPGQYRVRVRSFDDRGSPGDWAKPFNYVVRRPPPEVVKPVSVSREKLEWRAFPGAESYDVELAYKSGSAWKVWQTKSEYKATELPLDADFPGGPTKLTVITVFEGGEKSEPAVLETAVTAAAAAAPPRAEIKKDGNENTLSFAYLTSDAEYFGKFEDLGDATLKFNGDVTGLRVGWTHLLSSNDWGWTAIGEYSSFKVNGQGYGFGSVDGGVVWRKNLSGDLQLRVALGAAYRELPHVKGRTVASAKVENIAAAGPYGGAQLWYPASRTFGLLAHLQVTNLAVGFNMPSGQELKNGYEFQIGASGFYNVTERARLMLGVTSRSEAITYTSTDGQGINNVELEGGYLTAQFDWRF
jgi:hypothetical protein